VPRCQRGGRIGPSPRIIPQRRKSDDPQFRLSILRLII
jgi:hypothetical protein